MKPASCQLLVGLGNTGPKYIKNRHNAGFLFLDYWHAYCNKHNSQDIYGEWQEDKKFLSLLANTQNENFPKLAKPTTMMNSSGLAVAKLLNFYQVKFPELIVAFDDLDIALGEYKLQLATGPKVHNGLSSVYQKLGGKNFWHLRIGVENRAVRGNSGIKGIDYSLQDFNSTETLALQETFARIAMDLSTYLNLNTSHVSNQPTAVQVHS